MELGKFNIRVNCISPGGIYQNQSKEFIKKYSKLTPMGRMMRKDELNEIVDRSDNAYKPVTHTIFEIPNPEAPEVEWNPTFGPVECDHQAVENSQ